MCLTEAHRVLKKGGVMRFGVPTVECEDRDLNYLLGWNNINLFNKGLLRQVLDRIGFRTFTECDFGQSMVHELGIVDNRQDRGTKYFEVIK